tara:strand:+ start:26283 stop:28415 length:2133 start_codon:yes stop_codon:yes gene_type:complete
MNSMDAGVGEQYGLQGRDAHQEELLRAFHQSIMLSLWSNYIFVDYLLMQQLCVQLEQLKSTLAMLRNHMALYQRLYAKVNEQYIVLYKQQQKAENAHLYRANLEINLCQALSVDEPELAKVNEYYGGLAVLHSSRTYSYSGALQHKKLTAISQAWPSPEWLPTHYLSDVAFIELIDLFSTRLSNQLEFYKENKNVTGFINLTAYFSQKVGEQQYTPERQPVEMQATQLEAFATLASTAETSFSSVSDVMAQITNGGLRQEHEAYTANTAVQSPIKRLSDEERRVIIARQFARARTHSMIGPALARTLGIQGADPAKINWVISTAIESLNNTCFLVRKTFESMLEELTGIYIEEYFPADSEAKQYVISTFEQDKSKFIVRHEVRVKKVMIRGDSQRASAYGLRDSEWVMKIIIDCRIPLVFGQPIELLRFWVLSNAVEIKRALCSFPEKLNRDNVNVTFNVVVANFQSELKKASVPAETIAMPDWLLGGYLKKALTTDQFSKVNNTALVAAVTTEFSKQVLLANAVSIAPQDNHSTIKSKLRLALNLSTLNEEQLKRLMLYTTEGFYNPIHYTWELLKKIFSIQFYQLDEIAFAGERKYSLYEKNGAVYLEAKLQVRQVTKIRTGEVYTRMRFGANRTTSLDVPDKEAPLLECHLLVELPLAHNTRCEFVNRSIYVYEKNLTETIAKILLSDYSFLAASGKQPEGVIRFSP